MGALFFLLEAGEVAQLVGCLPPNHKDLNLDLHTHIKVLVKKTHNYEPTSGCGMVEDHWIPIGQ